MNLWRVAGSLALVAGMVWTGLLLPVQAQDKDKKSDEVKFTFGAFAPSKDKDGKEVSFFQKLDTTTTQEMSVEKGGTAMKQVQTQTFIIQWTPKEKKGSDFVLEQQIVYVKMDIKIGTTNIGYDSGAANQPKNPMTEFFGELMKVKLTIQVNDKMEVTNVEGSKEFVDKLGDSHPQMKNLLKSILGADAIKKMSEQTWKAIPLKSVKKGDTWEGEADLNLGPIGTYKNKYKYKLDSFDDKMAKISVTPSMIYSAPKDAGDKGDQLPFKIKGDSKLTSDDKDSSGTVIFDREKGRISESSMKMKVSGTVVIDIGGTDTRVELKQDQESKLTTADTKDALLKSAK